MCNWRMRFSVFTVDDGIVISLCGISWHYWGRGNSLMETAEARKALDVFALQINDVTPKWPLSGIRARGDVEINRSCRKLIPKLM